ncbi:MAG: N-acetyltransferase [Deltaproteobacteria bacterium]|nr:MAG: N-acetyltransferase [Deltaproteobacteria bacterium]
MKIRQSQQHEMETLQRIHAEAFGEVEGPVIAKLVHNLLHDDTARSWFSFVAEADGRVVGHIVFSAVTFGGHPECQAFILSPLAVLHAFQRQGVGQRLIAYGLGYLEAQGADLVLVYGDPSYYSRSGFTTDHTVQAPYRLQYPEGWLALELTQGMLKSVQGALQCADALSVPEYW